MFTAIKNFFMRGKASMANVMGSYSLTSITDHPRINIDPSEVERIKKDLWLYEAVPTKRKYTNLAGKEVTKKNGTFNFFQSACNRFSSILYNQNCNIQVDGSSGENDFINGILENNHFNGNFQRYISSMLATGGIVIRPYWDTYAQKIKLTWVIATNFYPLRSNTGEISEGAIAATTISGTHDSPKYYTLLEFHTWNNNVYCVDFELYLSNVQNIIGNQVPLSDVYPDLQDHTEYQGFKSPLFTYIKPAKFNNVNPNSPLGIGFADNSRSTLKYLDEAFTELGRSIRVSKQRIAITGDMASWLPDSNGVATSRPTFDLDDEVFTAIDGGTEQPTISDLTLKSPIESQRSTIDYLIHNFELQNNVSSGTFSMNDTATAITATQVVAENSTTYQTRASYLTNIEQGVKELVVAIFELASQTVTANGQTLWTGEIPDFDNISANFDDGVFMDRQSLITEVVGLKSQGLESQIGALKKIYNLTDEQAKAKAAEINAEKPPVTFGAQQSGEDTPEPDAEEE